MTLLAYAGRRTVGALVVLLVVVLLTMFAVASIGPYNWSTGPPRLIRLNEARGDMAEAWFSFPTQALAAVGLVAVAAIAWHLRLRRR